MKIAYLSDLHIDFWLNPAKNQSDRAIDIFINRYLENTEDCDSIIIAGDIGHYPKQNIRVLNRLPFKNKILVLGNHDLYSIGAAQKAQYKSYKDKQEESIQLYRDNGFIVLDGDTVTLNQVIIGGAASWYDGSYYHTVSNPYDKHNVIDYWKSIMNDHKLIKGLDTFYDLWNQERDKIFNLHNKCDVMVTHMMPCIEERFFEDKYRGQKSNSYYAFNYLEELVNDEKLKVWVHGHIHNSKDVTIFNKRILCNTLGYPGESNNKVKYFDI